MNDNNEVKHLKLEEIIPSRLQPRTEFNKEKLQELAISIKEYGIINPIIVRKSGDKYEIVAGERRYRASQMLGLTEIPVIISNRDDKTNAEIAVIENIQRENLSAIDEARAYRKLIDQNGLTGQELAEKIGKHPSTIANKMRLLNLCDEVQEALEKNEISERHARALLQLKNIDDQKEILDRIIKEKLTVKITETIIKEKIGKKNKINSQNLEESQTPLEQNVPTISNDNIYGNDIVSIDDLNKKELEKEMVNMNNNEQNLMNNNMISPEMTTTNTEQNIMPQEPVQPAPAFGGRFFPSLEDQPTNLNMNSNLNAGVNPAPQPMMENLVNVSTVAEPVQPVIPNIDNNMPVTPISQPVNPIPTNDISVPNIPVVEPNQPVQPTPEVSTFTPVIDQVVQPIPEMQPTPSPAPLVSPIEPVIPEINPASTDSPIAQNQDIAPLTDLNNPTTPIDTPVIPTPGPVVTDQRAENTFEPISPQILTEPTTPPTIEPVIEPVSSETTELAVPEIPNATPMDNQQQLESTTTIPESTIGEIIPDLPTEATGAQTGDVINAINAIKNLALSIQSIGYKLTMDEENESNKYRITIEIDK